MGVPVGRVVRWAFSLAVVAGAFVVVSPAKIGSQDVETVLPPPSVAADARLSAGAGGPIAIIGTKANPFSTYYAEILRTEGLNAFSVADIGEVTAGFLAAFDVVLLAEMSLTAAQVRTISNWVEQGGNLIAMRPDPKLGPLLGLRATAGSRVEAYVRTDASAPAGAGITSEAMQFHGAATHYHLAGARPVAMLYADGKTSTEFPAATIRAVGTSGGEAAAFAYDLARSVVYTRQGNPAWAGQRRDGEDGPIRADNLFFGAAPHDLQPDWVDFEKIEIPQADEQQRLLANLITLMAADRKPVPRFWYFPRGLRAAVVMTMDEHGRGDVPGRLARYDASSPPACSVDEWACIRSTTYLFADTTITREALAHFQGEGHEFGAHIDTGCADLSDAALASAFTTQMAALRRKFPDLAEQATQRTHCIAFSDWLTQPLTERAHGIRLDTNYYYWPPAWIRDRPGLFTGSGLPMRFADVDGAMIDVFQATTQMTNESGQSYPRTVEVLLDNALGDKGYYGAFVANIHTDGGPEAEREADAIIAAALSRGVPVISARQLLDWLDGRNSSSFAAQGWRAGAFEFTIAADPRAAGLVAMLPTHSSAGVLREIACGDEPVAFDNRRIKGIEYAMFAARSSPCRARYER